MKTSDISQSAQKKFDALNDEIIAIKYDLSLAQSGYLPHFFFGTHVEVIGQQSFRSVQIQANAINDIDEKDKCLVFGYMRQLSCDVYRLNIPIPLIHFIILYLSHLDLVKEYDDKLERFQNIKTEIELLLETKEDEIYWRGYYITDKKWRCHTWMESGQMYMEYIFNPPLKEAIEFRKGLKLEQYYCLYNADKIQKIKREFVVVEIVNDDGEVVTGPQERDVVYLVDNTCKDT